MSDKEFLDDPTNRIVAVLDDSSSASAAIGDLSQHGITEDEIRMARGDEAAEEVDTSAKWFADTDDEIEKYQTELKAGRIVLSIPVKDSPGREAIHGLLKQHGARHITHFGQWVTEMMR